MSSDNFTQPEEFTGVVVEAPEKRKREYSPYTPQPTRHRRWPWFCMGCLFLCCLCWVLPLCLLGVAGASIGSLFDRNAKSASGTTSIPLTTLKSGDELTLDVRGYVGNITVRGVSDANEVRIDYTKTAYGFKTQDSENTLNDITVTGRLENQTAVVRVEDRQNFRDFFSRTFKVDMTITVPENVHLRIRSNIGTITVSNVHILSSEIENNVDLIELNSVVFDPAGDHEISSTMGEILLHLPVNTTYVQVNGATDVGNITIASPFTTSNVESGSESSGASWRGVIGSGTGEPANLRLRSTLGNIQIDTNETVR